MIQNEGPNTVLGAGEAGGTVRTGILGYGNAGKLIHAPLLNASAGFSLAAVSSSRIDVVQAEHPNVAIYQDAEEMCAAPDLDLIIVATPPDSHARWAKAALSGGKHVLVEKPFALDVEDAADIFETASRSGKQVFVFHNRRYDSCFLSIKAAIESGRLGRINHFESQYVRFSPAVQAEWGQPPVAGSGVWYDLGSHLVDQAVQLFGMPESICLDMASNRPGSIADDWFHANLHYRDKRVILHGSLLVAGGVPRFIVHGDQASAVKVERDCQGEHLWRGVSPDAAEFGSDQDPLISYSADGSRTAEPASRGDYRLFYNDVHAAISGTASNPTPQQDMMAVMSILQSGIVSAKEKRAVAITNVAALI